MSRPRFFTAMPLSLRRYRKMLLASGLMEVADLRTFERSLPRDRRPAEADDLSRRLIEAGKLTEFQAAEIQAGRGSALVLGNYVVFDRIGAGGMGQVFKALHRRMQRLVALKTLPDQRSAGEDSIARFRREILSAAQLSHPNIVSAYDADVAQRIHFLVMEYVDGPNLADLVRKSGPLPLALAVRYVLDAAQGLAYAHQCGIVHRDVKPSNLIVSPSGSVKVLDLGLARGAGPTVGAELTMPGDVVGTLEYMAPEQAAGSTDIDGRADVYGLGCTLYRLITGELPYRGASPSALIAAHREDKIPSLRASRDDVPRSLDNVFKRMVAKQAAERFQTMDEVIRALEKLRLVEKRPSREGSGRASPSADLAEGAQAASAWANSASGSGGDPQQSVPGGRDEESGDDLELVGTAGGPVVFTPADGSENNAPRPSAGIPPVAARPDKPSAPVSPLVALAALVAGMVGISALSWFDSGSNSDHSNSPRRAGVDSAAPRELARGWSQSLGLPASMTNSLGMSFVLIPPADDPDHEAGDAVRTPFYYGACELTVAQFRRFVQATGYRVASHGSRSAGVSTRPGGAVSPGGTVFPGGIAQGDRHPVIGLTPADAEAFCRWLSQVEAASYRLPTQAEWAHACGAGPGGRWWFGKDATKLDRYAWYQSNSGARTHQVGLLEGSPLGLHDLIGNAAEWCVAEAPLSGGNVTRPSTSGYVLCGGCWSSPATALGPTQAAHDTLASTAGGLRLVLELPLEARWAHRSAASLRRSTR